MREREKYQSKQSSGSGPGVKHSVAVDRWPWRQEGADLLQHRVAELAPGRATVSFSLSLSW